MTSHSQSSALADGLLTTGDMARLSGSTLRTVRFYEEEGLVAPVERADRGHRHFEQSQLRKLELALHLREAGMSIADVKRLFGLKSGSGDPDLATRGMTDALRQQVADLGEKIAKLQQLEQELTEMMRTIAGCESCTHVGFPQRCERCDVLQGPDRSRAIDVLWR